MSQLTKKGFWTIMSSGNVMGQLEQRAVQAEQVIDLLTKQIAQLQQVSLDKRKLELQQENQKLRQEVDRLKNKLVDVESAQGIKQYYDFSKKCSPPPSGVSDPTPVPAAAPVQQQPDNQQKEKTDKKAEKKDKKKADGGDKKGGGGAKKPEDDLPVDVSRLDFRVGRIVTAKKHPDADSLYVEEVDIGEGKMRTVVSGLVRFIPVEEMQDRMAVLMCNLKPAKMRGVTSEAMVMCASTPEKVEILSPPNGSQPGDLVEFEGYTRNPDGILNPKKKIFEACAPDLKTDGNRIATYKGVPFTVPGKGVVTAPSLTNVQVK
ncbi:unnamed protein product, partial [Meganyctiphanes norvegica]